MQWLLDLLNQLGALNIMAMVGALTTFLVVVVLPIAKVIPGNFPDAQVQWLVDLLKKIPSVGAKKE